MSLNRYPMKLRPQLVFIKKFDAHSSKSLQDIRQNYRMENLTVTYICFEVKGCVPLTYYETIWCSSIKCSSKYKAKSLDHEI